MNACNNNRRSIAGALRLMSLAAAALLLAACAPTLVKTEAAQKPARTVLILTGAGMVPASSGDPRYEQVWLQAAAQYSEGLSKAINAAGLYAQVHLRKDRSESVESTFTKLVGGDRKDALLQVTVKHVRTATDNTVYLIAQFMPLEYRFYSNGQRRVVPVQGTEKQYPILSTTRPDLSKTSLTELAQQFVSELRAQGHLR